MTKRSIAHGSFTVERRYPAKPARVFAAFADKAKKPLWFGAPGAGEQTTAFDFRVGGRESATGLVAHDTTYAYDALYHDIVPDERIVYSYDMHFNGQRISVSLATVEIRSDGAGTHLVLTEHGAFLDGLDNVRQRHQGTEGLMDRLGETLAD